MKKIVLLTIVLWGISYRGSSQTLDDYLEMAALNNPGLQARYKAFEAAMEKVPQVNGFPDPNLSFGYFISPVETRVGPQRARFSLSQMFPWFGTLRARGDAATLSAEARYQAFLNARNQLFYRVGEVYYSLFELDQLIRIERENAALLRSYKNIAEVKFENGKGSMVDVLRADIMLQEAATDLDVLKAKRKPLLTGFNNLLNRAEDDPVTLPDSLDLWVFPLDYGRDSLWVSHPLIEELELQIKASEASEKEAQKQGFPKIGVGLDYVIVGERTDMSLPDNGKDVIMPMVSMSLPVFRGKYKAARKEAELMQESFTLQKEELTNQLVSSYEMTQFEILRQQKLAELYSGQILESERSLGLLFTAYGNSGKDFEEVLRMQQQLLKYRKMKATALAAYHTALAQLDYLTAKTK